MLIQTWLHHIHHLCKGTRYCSPSSVVTDRNTGDRWVIAPQGVCFRVPQWKHHQAIITIYPTRDTRTWRATPSILVISLLTRLGEHHCVCGKTKCIKPLVAPERAVSSLIICLEWRYKSQRLLGWKWKKSGSMELEVRRVSRSELSRPL